MSKTRFAALGLLCLFASACTVVVQPNPNQPRTAPTATDSEADVDVTNPEPVQRPPAQVPRRRPANAERDTGDRPSDSPTRRPPGRSNGLTLGVPPGHLPGPGECRVWIEGLPPGQQARARSCSGILATAPPGSWILYRPAQYQRQVRVRYLHDTRRTVIAVRAFDSETGAYLRDFALEEDDDNMGPVAVGARRPTNRPGGERPANRGNSDNAPGRINAARDSTATSGNADRRVGRESATRDTTNSQVNSGNQENRENRGNQGNQGNQGNRGNRDADVRAENPAGNPISRGERDPAITAVTTDSNAVAAGGNDPTRRRDAAIRGSDVDRQADSEAEPAFLGIHPRFLPRGGLCRIWMPSLPEREQAGAASCDGLVDDAPAGAWILRSTTDEPTIIYVDYVDEERAGVITRTAAFNARTGEGLPEPR